jgi:molybdate transport system substrate-binding protein
MPTPVTAAAEINVMHGGAFTQVMRAIVPDFERATGHRVVPHRDTVGALTKKIAAGDPFDMAVLTPEAIDRFIVSGRIVPGSRRDIARVGIGVVIKEGTPPPDISNVDAFRRTLMAARSVAYIDPQAGGSSGIYLAGLFERLGVADALKPKAVLIHGGAVAKHVADGEAEIGIHQISEILPVEGTVLVGPLPDEVQNYTTYSAGIAATAREPAAARALIAALAGPQAAAVIRSKGMEPAAAG